MSKVEIAHEGQEGQDSISNENSLASLSARLGKDTLVYFPSSLVPAIITTTIAIIVTRIFEPIEYGIYAVVIATLNILTLLLTSWIRQSTLRYRAEYVASNMIGDFNKGLVQLLLSTTVILLIIVTPVYLIFRTHMGIYQKYYLPSAAYIVTNLWFISVSGILMADLRSKLYSLFISINSILSLSISLTIVLQIRRDLVGLIWGIFLSEAFVLPFMLYASKVFSFSQKSPNRDPIKDRLKVGIRFAQKIASYGVPLIGWFVGAYLLNLSDRYLIQIFRGSAEVGIYSPNYNLVTGVFGLVTAPILLAAHAILMKVSVAAKSKQEMQSTITEFSRYYLLVAIPLLAFVAMYAEDIVSMFLGDAYHEGYKIIPIILLGYLAWNFGLYGHKGLELEERTRAMFFYVLICAIVNIVLNIVFIPWLGYLGAAITSLIGLMLYPILVYIGTRKIFPWIIPWISVLRITGASLIMGSVLFIFKLATGFRASVYLLIIAAIIGVFMYLISLYFLKEVRPYELVQIKKYLRF